MKRMRSAKRTSGGCEYQQDWDCSNPAYREKWVETQLRAIRPMQGKLLDVGAGTGPYRNLAEDLGFDYRAHDFAQYVPNPRSQGLQNPSWNVTTLDFECDILEIPERVKFEVVLCTEVLEHVPDAVASFRKLSAMVADNGVLLVTVPMLSLMHQAPHWHAAGLSPFFFHYWSERFGLQVDEITVHGDYVDLMRQEVRRLISGSLGRIIGAGVAVVLRPMFCFARLSLSDEILSSGRFGVTLRASKPSARGAVVSETPQPVLGG